MLKFLFLLAVVLSAALGASIRQRGLAPRLDGRIVGGEPTSIEQYPHHASLRYSGYHRCGCSIVSVKVILTAAHCTFGIATSYLAVVAGVTNLSDANGFRQPVQSKVEHEGFDPWEYLDDVALLWLETGLEFGRTIQSIKLARHGDKLKTGTKVYMTGWGTIYSGGPSPDQLQDLYVSVVGNKECAEMYGDINPITDAMMCTGEPYGGKDACQGDSGGPVISNGVQYGIVSWGVGCAIPEYPGVLADVGNLRPWIDSKLAMYGS